MEQLTGPTSREVMKPRKVTVTDLSGPSDDPVKVTVDPEAEPPSARVMRTPGIVTTIDQPRAAAPSLVTTATPRTGPKRPAETETRAVKTARGAGEADRGEDGGRRLATGDFEIDGDGEDDSAGQGETEVGAGEVAPKAGMIIKGGPMGGSRRNAPTSAVTATPSSTRPTTSGNRCRDTNDMRSDLSDHSMPLDRRPSAFVISFWASLLARSCRLS